MKNEVERMPITLKGRIVGTAIVYDDNTIHALVWDKEDYEHILENNVPWMFDTISMLPKKAE